MPRDQTQTRNTVRIMLSMLPADLAALDALAAKQADPGMPPNRSAAFRVALRGYLNAEADREREARKKRK
jgi:hypothetical protein